MDSKVTELVEILNKSLNPFDKQLAKDIVKDKTRSSFDPSKDLDRGDRINARLYKKFKKMITPEYVERLQSLDDELVLEVEDLSQRTGWTIGYQGAHYYDNFQNMEDPEFRSFDSYLVPRNPESGYYVKTDEPINDHMRGIREVETKFYLENQDSLESIHSLLVQKRSILSGEYELAVDSEENRVLAGLLADYVNMDKISEKTVSLGKTAS